jgi:inosose dehydratase
MGPDRNRADDLVDIQMDSSKVKYPFKFVELGQGRVDLPAVFKSLDEIKYRGWAVVELDHVTSKSRTAKESAMISKNYLDQKIAVRV